MSGDGSANLSGRTHGCGRRRELFKRAVAFWVTVVEGVTLYGFVDAQKAEGFPVRLICSVVGVSPSAYYAPKQRAPAESRPAGRGRPGRRDPRDLGRVRWDLRFAQKCAQSYAGGVGW